MLFGIGNYVLSATIGGTGSPAPAALTPLTALFDSRTGSVASMQWGGGAQTTGSYVELTITVASTYASPARIGVIHIANVIGLPEGTKVDINVGTISQRLIAGRRGELGVVIYPNALATNTVKVRFYNDVNGSPSIPALTAFAVGEIFIGGLCGWPLLIDEAPPMEVPVDSTQWQRSDGGQLWQFMRKPIGSMSVALGRVGTLNATGGATLATNPSGLTASGKMDARTLMYLLSTTTAVHLCAYPHKGFRDRGTINANGFYIDPTMASVNGMLARCTGFKNLAMDKPPYFSFGFDIMEAT